MGQSSDDSGRLPRRPRGARRCVGLVLAAGEGRRMGQPKALVRDGASGLTWVELAVRNLAHAGLTRILVVVGAAEEEVSVTLLSGDWGWREPFRARVEVLIVDADDWQEGMGNSLRSGIDAALQVAPDEEALLVTLVDLPDVGPEVHRRMLRPAGRSGSHAGELRAGLWRAAYDGIPGHPVLLGRDHWAGVHASAVGDRGARDYFREHPPVLVECGDLATGRDVDSPADLA